eukprot:gene16567-biopygen21807
MRRRNWDLSEELLRAQEPCGLFGGTGHARATPAPPHAKQMPTARTTPAPCPRHARASVLFPLGETATPASGPRPARVRFFQILSRAPRPVCVLSASAAVSPWAAAWDLSLPWAAPPASAGETAPPVIPGAFEARAAAAGRSQNPRNHLPLVCLSIPPV